MTRHAQLKRTGLYGAAGEKVCPEQNHVLSALSPDERKRLFPALRLVYLSLGNVLYESGSRPRHMYFPTDCIVSLLNVLKDGASTGVAAVGNDGAIGVALFTGGETMTNRAVVQRAGFAYRLTGARLKDELAHHGQLFQILLRYAQALITQTSQTAVCNRHHSVDQQLCRWLLMSLDRQSSNELTMTQELIANILGVRREGVTESAGRLQKQGVIRYRRGQITVLDRHRLEQLSCECYSTVKQETDRLLQYVRQAAPLRPVPGARHRVIPGPGRSSTQSSIDVVEAKSDVSTRAGCHA